MTGQWLGAILMFSAGMISLGIWGRLIYNGFRDKNMNEIVTSATAFSSMLVWIISVLIQNWSATIHYPLYSLSLKMGYVIFLFSLVTVWRVVWMHAAPCLLSVLKVRRNMTMFTLAFLGYGIFYVFASGMFLFPPEEEKLHQSFFNLYRSYSLLTEWPSLSFGIHKVNLAGTITLDTLLLFVTVTLFMAVNFVLLFNNWKETTGRNLGMVGRTAGSTAAITLSSFSCCSLPLLYPLLTILAGSTAAKSLSYRMIHESGVLFNLLQIMILSLVSFTSVWLAKRLRHCKL